MCLNVSLAVSRRTIITSRIKAFFSSYPAFLSPENGRGGGKLGKTTQHTTFSKVGKPPEHYKKHVINKEEEEKVLKGMSTDVTIQI